MAKLSTSKRARLKKSEFALPGKIHKGKRGARDTEGAFPLNDKAHDRAAIRLAPRSYNAGNISKSEEKEIIRKAKKKLGKAADHQHPQSHAEFEKLGRD